MDLNVRFDVPVLSSGETYTLKPIDTKPDDGYSVSILSDSGDNGFYSVIEADSTGEFTIAGDGTARSDLSEGAANQKISVTTNSPSTSWDTTTAEGVAGTLKVNPANANDQNISTDSNTTLSITVSNLYNAATLTGAGTVFTLSEPNANEIQLVSDGGIQTASIGHSVVFYTGGGTTIDTQTNIPSGGQVTRPADPTKAGSIFVGWYTTPELTTPYDFSTPLTQDLRLYAKWDSNTEPLFDDVTGHWVVTEGWLEKVVSKGLMNGYKGTNHFGPDDFLTRGQVAAILWRNTVSGANSDAPSQNKTPFIDNPDNTYYTEAINWAHNNNLLTGYTDASGNLVVNPEGFITREELATILCRYASFSGADTSGVTSDSFKDFLDASSVSDWATDGVGWCVAHHVMSGIGGTGYLAPRDTTTRAQMAKMVV